MSTATERAGLSETQRQIVDLAREFARTRIEPQAAEWDRTARFPADVVAELGGLGFLGLVTPESHDGMGLDALTYLLVLEELAAADAGLAISVHFHHAAQRAIGTPGQQERWLAPLARGEMLATLALGDPEPGTVSWVTNGATVGLAVVRARGPSGVAAALVPTDTAGYRPGKAADSIGLRSAPIVPVALDGVEVPADHLLGDEQPALDFARLGTATAAVGIARRALEHAVGYCAERRQFGKALREFEAVQFKLAEMATRVAGARALAHQAAAMGVAGMARLCASAAAEWVTIQAIQLFGGYGYMRDFPVEKLLRDAKALERYDATGELQRLIVARDLYAGR
ncbi:MAG TPA: acyl-CoA dehydrogenase family protein [Gemmatimonadales bacterium]|nr:acyl-CoA dehydrogenase family protein [Gemmatimonadales bacterium]